MFTSSSVLISTKQLLDWKKKDDSLNTEIPTLNMKFPRQIKCHKLLKNNTKKSRDTQYNYTQHENKRRHSV